MVMLWFWLLVACAGLFTAVYLPAIARWSRTLSSPYAKADVQRRLAAATLDGLLILSCLVFYATTESTSLLVAGAGYALLRDAFGGQSVGKFFYSLMVVRLDTGRPAGMRSSMLRNVVLLVPGANVAAVFLETWTLVSDPKGARLGDRMAWTQVVDGFGVRELVKILRDQLTVDALLDERKPRLSTFDFRLSTLDLFGAPGRIRTCGLRLRRPSLYPAELRAQTSAECLVLSAECIGAWY
jgi:uncharacterized RDD family membrane protein YckC